MSGLARAWIALAAILLVLLAAGVWLLRFETVLEPALAGALETASLEFAGRTRSYAVYRPQQQPPAPAIVFALHGSMGDGDQARRGFAYEFDRLAEAGGFLAVYPDGVERHWNGCRAAGPYLANRENVDDVGFLRSLTAELVAKHGADPKRVFATGISNGGQMALRLALEAPDLVRAVAPLVASLPAEDNMGCRPEGRPVSLLLMNGTEDPMNPYAGGVVALYGLLGNRGRVLSSEETVAYWAELAGYEDPPQERTLPDLDPGDGSRVVVHEWRAPGRARVALYAVEGGGHSAPHPEQRIPRLFGRTNGDISAAEEIWEFFREAPPLGPRPGRS